MQRVLNHTIALTFNTVTGASTGFGRELAKIVLENGDTAVATARRPEVLADLVAKYPADRLLTLKLDVTKQQDVLDAFSAAQAKFGRVDVVANNAAFITLGEIESVPDADARAMFETNFWGAAWVSREAVRFFREVNPKGAGGRLLQISSTCGFQGVPGTAYYSATKFGQFLAFRGRGTWTQMVAIVPSSSRRIQRDTRLGNRSRLEHQGERSIPPTLYMVFD